MSVLPHRIAGTIGLLIAGGAIAAGTLTLADGRITPGIITLLCAVICATTAVANLNIAARTAALNRLAKTREEQTTEMRAAYAQASLNARRAGDHITMREIADTVERWAITYEAEKIGGTSAELALATAFAETIAHERRPR